MGAMSLGAAAPGRLRVAALLVAFLLVALPAAPQDVPELRQPVNDFAGVVDQASAASMDRTIRALRQATGDTIVVATVDTFAPFGDIREYAVELFENHGRGIGEKGRDNGLLILLAVRDRRVWIEVGYGLEEFVTDGFAGETSRDFMTPAFRQGQYGAGLQAGVARLTGRIAQARNVTLTGVPAPEPARGQRGGRFPAWLLILVVIIILLAASGGGGAGLYGGRRMYRRGWGGGGWSGWSSGIGSFGGGSGGFGGGFGGFGGGRSGGGGGGASW
jgi:uncharacterized protein